MFAGSYSLAVDEKGRIAIPARYRQELGDEGGTQLVVTMGRKPCLEIYKADHFQVIAKEIQELEDRRAADILRERFIGLAHDVEADRQGRMVLPPMLRKRARLNGSAVMMGQIRYLTVWSEEEWTRLFGDSAEQAADAALLEDALSLLKQR